MHKSKAELFFVAYSELAEEYIGKTKYDFCLSFKQEQDAINKIDESLHLLTRMAKQESLESRLTYATSLLGLDASNINDIQLFHSKMIEKVKLLLCDNRELNELLVFNRELISFYEDCLKEDAQSPDLDKISEIVNNKLYKDACTYSNYLASNIILIFKSYNSVMELLRYCGHYLLVIEMIGYVDEVLEFLNTIYSFYTLSNKSVLIHKLIIEFENLKALHFQKIINDFC